MGTLQLGKRTGTQVLLRARNGTQRHGCEKSQGRGRLATNAVLKYELLRQNRKGWSLTLQITCRMMHHIISGILKRIFPKLYTRVFFKRIYAYA